MPDPLCYLWAVKLGLFARLPVSIRPDPGNVTTRSGRYAAEGTCNDHCLLGVRRSGISDDHDSVPVQKIMKYGVCGDAEMIILLAFEHSLDCQ
jgi:hypothetical protein